MNRGVKRESGAKPVVINASSKLGDESHGHNVDSDVSWGVILVQDKSDKWLNTDTSGMRRTSSSEKAGVVDDRVRKEQSLSEKTSKTR